MIQYNSYVLAVSWLGYLRPHRASLVLNRKLTINKKLTNFSSWYFYVFLCSQTFAVNRASRALDAVRVKGQKSPVVHSDRTNPLPSSIIYFVIWHKVEGGNGGVLARCTTRLFWPFTCTAWSARLARFTANVCEHKNTSRTMESFWLGVLWFKQKRYADEDNQAKRMREKPQM